MTDTQADETLVEVWADNADEEVDSGFSAATTAYLSGTDWTVETVLSQLRQGNIDLSPNFQRRSVWSEVRMSRFIESLVIGFPVPQIVLAEDKFRKGAFIVLDGKQRLSALQRFATEQLDSSTSNDPAALRIRGLDLRTELNGMTLSDMKGRPELQDDLRLFFNRTLRTVVISNWSDESYLNLAFHRLNTGSVSLSAQELRQALYPGPFSTRIDEYAGGSVGLRQALRSDAPDFRMRDTELAIRFVAFSLRFENYGGNLKKFLDETVSYFNTNWSTEELRVEHSLRELERALEVAAGIFGRNAFRRFRGIAYESLFNRAVFDVQALYLSLPSVRAAVADRGLDVEEAFKRLCVDDPEFIASITATTKSLGATLYRLQAWGRALGSATAAEIPLPEIGTSGRLAWRALSGSNS